MVRCVFRSDNRNIFRTEAEAVWHEQHVLALGKLEALLVESSLIRQAKQEQSVVNEEFISRLIALLLSHPVKAAIADILRNFDEKAPKLNFSPVGPEMWGD